MGNCNLNLPCSETASAPNDIAFTIHNTGRNGLGLLGTAISPGAGVQGDGETGVIGVGDSIGVLGISANFGFAVDGRSDNVGVYAHNSSVPARNNLPPGNDVYLAAPSVAGDFYGDVFIHGKITVQGSKSAAVRHPDGSHRRLYCTESPESWFEDFGQGNLANGNAEVSLDPEFAALVHSESYQVFLTEYGDSNGLYVSTRTSTSFTVRERGGGASRIEFGYRLVSKRKDIRAPRLEKVTIPTPPSPPEMPERIRLRLAEHRSGVDE